MKKPRHMYDEHKIPTPVRRLFLIGLIPALLLGLYIGHLTADGATDSSAPAVTLQLAADGDAIPLAEYQVRVFRHFGYRWHPVTEALADALAEGSAPDATTRVWENCAIRIPMRGDRNRMSFVICPDGYIEHW
jgi:hypothetical protein